jgi:hypothetical protein
VIQLSLFDDASEQLGLEAHFIASHGLLAVLEMLEVKTRRDTAAGLLKIVNTVSPASIVVAESLAHFARSWFGIWTLWNRSVLSEVFRSSL